MANNQIVKIDQNLVQKTQSVITTSEQLITALQDFRTKTTCLVPETLNVGVKPELKMALSLISIDPTVDEFGNGRDIYKIDGTYVFHLGKLKEIAQRSNVTVTSSKVTEVQSDEKGRVILIKHELQWERLDLDGFVRRGVTTGTYDYNADKLHRAKQAEKRNKHAFSHAESNAYTRMVNDAIANLPRGLTLAEISKPVLVYSVVEDKNELLKDLPDEVQLEIKKARAAAAFGVSAQIYGQKPAELPAPQQNLSLPEHAAQAHTEAAQYEVVTPSELSPVEQNRILANEFRDVPQQERTEKILNLCRIKNVKNKNGSEVTDIQLEKTKLDDQITFLEKLLNLPDAEERLPLC